MKKFQSVTLLAVLFTLFTTVKMFAQTTAKTATVKIKTSAQCDDCKARIEKKVGAMDGVSKADLDVDSKVLTVEYDPAKTSPEKIRKVISKIGYDADDVKANAHAQKELPKCCKPKTGSTN